MKKNLYNKLIVGFVLIFIGNILSAQTLKDGLFMPKNNICGGIMYSYGSWTEYWEGTLKRDNPNFGRVSTQSLAFMINYGISDKLNIIAGLPYIWTKASAGTLSGQKGIQDLSFGLKYQVWEQDLFKGKISFVAIGGASLPLSNYVADFLPMSIGLQSKNLFGRGLIQFTHPSHFNFSIQGAYIHRANIKIDREAYYTTEMIYSNEVRMPDIVNFSVRAAYQTSAWGIDLMLEQNNCLSGHDIRRNDMPFPSNQMDATQAGVGGFYKFSKWGDLQLIASWMRVLDGRNVGQTNTYSLGLMKGFNLNKKASE